MKCSILLHFIRVFTVCESIHFGVSPIKGLGHLLFQIMNLFSRYQSKISSCELVKMKLNSFLVGHIGLPYTNLWFCDVTIATITIVCHGTFSVVFLYIQNSISYSICMFINFHIIACGTKTWYSIQTWNIIQLKVKLLKEVWINSTQRKCTSFKSLSLSHTYFYMETMDRPH